MNTRFYLTILSCILVGTLAAQQSIKSRLPDWFFKLPQPAANEEVYAIGISDPGMDNTDMARQQAIYRSYYLVSMMLQSNVTKFHDSSSINYSGVTTTKSNDIANIHGNKKKIEIQVVDSFTTKYNERMYLVKGRLTENGLETQSITNSSYEQIDNKLLHTMESICRIEGHDIYYIIKDSSNNVVSVMSSVDKNFYKKVAKGEYVYKDKNITVNTLPYGLWQVFSLACISSISKSGTDFRSVSKEAIKNKYYTFSIESIRFCEQQLCVELKVESCQIR
ncbi:hypothetical protein [uncultured Bacteroides sp.]|uniref:hypothetical protein n=1 Tax=uncultured Bacteroides sp. TaxID=162156 RepID=UPI002AAB39BF|nr:hypothetical protein [uncultured Bacteroides sp.]